MLLTAIILWDTVLYRYPFALELAESLVAVETCFLQAKTFFLSHASGGTGNNVGWS